MMMVSTIVIVFFAAMDTTWEDERKVFLIKSSIAYARWTFALAMKMTWRLPPKKKRIGTSFVAMASDTFGKGLEPNSHL
jgi:hypothetical protein